ERRASRAVSATLGGRRRLARRDGAVSWRSGVVAERCRGGAVSWRSTAMGSTAMGGCRRRGEAILRKAASCSCRRKGGLRGENPTAPPPTTDSGGGAPELEQTILRGQLLLLQVGDAALLLRGQEGATLQVRHLRGELLMHPLPPLELVDSLL